VGPSGWDAAFWEGVRERIDDHKLEPDPPEAPPTSPFTVVTWALFVAFSTAVLFGGGATPRKEAPRDDPGSTFVRVSGAQPPSVDVEWARAGGCRSGFVVLQAIDPDVSYVVLESRPARQAVAP